MSLSGYFLLLSLLLLSAGGIPAAAAGTDVRVLGLFKDRAVLLIDGRRQVLRTGEQGAGGVRLISADSESAVLEVDGKRSRRTLDGRVRASNRQATGQTVQIMRNNNGMYTTAGSINGQPVTFMVDTGATQVAMNAAAARRLGIDYRVVGTRTVVTTASGTEPAWAVTLDTVRVGEILLRDVGGLVLEGAQPSRVLLGMSYLGRLEITNSGRLLTLRRKY